VTSEGPQNTTIENVALMSVEKTGSASDVRYVVKMSRLEGGTCATVALGGDHSDKPGIRDSFSNSCPRQLWD
jgi:hypothetical protein